MFSIMARAIYTSEDGPPSAARVAPVARRELTRFVRMVVDVIARLEAEVDIDAGHVPLVIGSAHGDGTTTSELDREQPLEPVVAIDRSLGRSAPSVLVSAGPETPAVALMEAAIRCAASSTGTAVVVVCDDASTPAASVASYAALAVGFVVASDSRGVGVGPPYHGPPGAGSKGIPASVREHPCVGALALARALERGPCRVCLEPPRADAAPVWWLDVLAGAQASRLGPV